MIKRKTKNYKKVFIGTILLICLCWWGITFLYVFIKNLTSDKEMEEITDKLIASQETTYDYNFMPTGQVEVMREYISKENKLAVLINYRKGKAQSVITCEVKPHSNLIPNWVYLFKGGNWNNIQKEYNLSCSQQDFSEQGKILSEFHYAKYVKGLEDFIHSNLYHKLGDNINCSDATDYSYVVYESNFCNYNTPGYNSEKGCIKNECIWKGNGNIEKSYYENGFLEQEDGPNYRKKYNENGELILESKEDHGNSKIYGYFNNRLISELSSKKGELQEIKRYSPETGDMTYELYFKNGKPSYGFKYENGNKIPMTNSHLREKFGRYIKDNQTFEE